MTISDTETARESDREGARETNGGTEGSTYFLNTARPPVSLV